MFSTKSCFRALRVQKSCVRVFSRSKLTVANMNANAREMQYAVRGAVVVRADELKKELAKKNNKLPFDEIIYCNIGNPQQLQQPPITFVRQVLSLVENPTLLKDESVVGSMNEDVVKRAKTLLAGCENTTGAYTHSKGLPIVRESVAKFIEKRDGFESNPEHIFVTDGASPAVKAGLGMLLRDNRDGILCPIPQYPLYSASITLLGGALVPYYLNEENKWDLSVDELERAHSQAASDGVDVRALVVINPGNPTGQVLSSDSVHALVEWADKKDVVLLADEVYQENVYAEDKEFVSFKKALSNLKSNAQLMSFHSVSKGVLGECGKRGGYMEMVNFPADVIEQAYKMVSVNLCSNVIGQLTVELMVNPPQQGDPSYDLYRQEVDGIFNSLKYRAGLLADSLNSLEGVTCNPPEGAMYAFPQLRLPQKAIDAAKERGVAPDAMYCLDLLEQTGIVVVPGSGFGQVNGTYHFRTTFLPREHHVEKVAKLMSEFHKDFMNKYR